MKDFPTKLTPENLKNFSKYRKNRQICKLKQELYEFMLTNDFINNKNRGFELGEYANKNDIIEPVIQSLKSLGWEVEIALYNTYMFIYPPGEKPKMLNNLFNEL